MANQQYILKTDDRWDNIAFKAYGDANMVDGIVEANPEVLITAIVPAGTILNIPIISADEQTSATISLPPWLQ